MSAEQFSDTVKGIQQKERELVNAIKTILGITPKVHLVSPKSIVRSEGKAVRVIDTRKLHSIWDGNTFTPLIISISSLLPMGLVIFTRVLPQEHFSLVAGQAQRSHKTSQRQRY